MGLALRKRLGARSLELPAGSVAELLDALEVDREDEDLRVLVNGRSIQWLDGMDTRADEGDVVTLHYSGVRGFPGG